MSDIDAKVIDKIFKKPFEQEFEFGDLKIKAWLHPVKHYEKIRIDATAQEVFKMLKEKNVDEAICNYQLTLAYSRMYCFFSMKKNLEGESFFENEKELDILSSEQIQFIADKIVDAFELTEDEKKIALKLKTSI
jgi:hypothetical protein